MKKIFVISLLIMSIFLVSIVSAAEFDNVKYEKDKTFDGKDIDGNKLLEKYKPIEIKNIFGLGATLFEGYISKHDETCGVDCSSTIEVKTGKDGVLIDDVIFKTLQEDESWVEQNVRSYQFSYWGEVDDFETQCIDLDEVCSKNINRSLPYCYTPKECSQVKIGSHIGWVNYALGDELPKGTYTIKLDAEKKPIRTVDWVIKTNGEWLESWAVWQGVNDLIISTNQELCGNQSGYNNIIINNSATVTVCADGNITFGAYGNFTMESGVTINGITSALTTGTGSGRSQPCGDCGCGAGGASHNSSGGSGGAANAGCSCGGGAAGSTYGVYDSQTSITKGSIGQNKGGNFIMIGANNIKINGEINLNGQNGAAGGTSNCGNGGYGGGSGGQIIIKGTSVNISSSDMDVSGGNGGAGQYNGACSGSFAYAGGGGGAGAGGMISVFYEDSISNTSLTTDVTGGSGGSAATYNGGTASNGAAGTAGTIYYSQETVDIEGYGLIDLNSPADNYETTISNNLFNATANVIGGATIVNMSLWTNETGSWAVRNSTTGLSGTTETQTWTRSLSDGSYLWGAQACDSEGACGFSANRTIFIDTIAPTFVVENPTGILGYTAVGDNETLNITVDDINLDSCWYNYNGTNVTIEGCVTGVKNSTQFILENDNLNMTIYVNDSFGNLNSETSTWSYIILEIAQTYDANAYETTANEFSINITYNSSVWSSVIGRMVYNGTSSSGTASGTGDNIIFSYDTTVPVLTADTNYTFYWSFTLTNVTGSYVYNSTTQNQSVFRVRFSECPYSDQPQLFFKTFSTLTPTSVVNATFASAWTIKNADGGAAVFTRSFEDTAGTNSTWGFCITPNSTNYTVSVDVTVDATNYTATTHFIVDTDYTQTTQNISLYLLHDDDSTLTKIVIRDRDSQPVKDVYTTIQKYDVGTDTYYNVAMTRSDNNGEDLVYLAWYDYWYKFIGTLDGTVVFTEGPKKISETPQTFQTDELEDLLYEKFNNIIYTLVFNNVTKNFVLTYVDPSGEVTSNCLKVLKRSLTGDLIICDNCETSNSATMYCNIATEGNGTFVAIYYARASPTNFIDFITQLVNVQAQIYDQIGSDNATGMSILIAGIVVALFLVTPAMGIIGVILGVFLAVFLGFQPLDYAALGSIVVAGLLMVWAVQK